MKYWLSCLLALTAIPFGSFAQKKHFFQTEAVALIATSMQVPFWHRVNQFGAAPTALPALVGRVRAFSLPKPTIDSLGKRQLFDWNYGFEAVGNLASRSNAVLVEGYGGVRLGAFQLTLGRKREFIGLVDTLLTTGAVSYSGNALPIPKVQINTNGFVVIPFTKQLVAFQASFAHGWVGPQRISPNYFPNDNRLNYYGHYITTYFHQKTFYGRFGKPNWKITLYGGFNDLAFWGNEATIWNPNFQLSTLESFRRVVLGVNWEGSKVGNHFGTIDLAAKIKIKNWDILLYRQSIFDTGSLLNAFNLDALNGISFQRKTLTHNKLHLQKLLIEYIYTNDQRDPQLDLLGAGIGNGRNSYFNHYIYLDGWSYKNQALGTPFAVTDRNTKENVDNSDFKGGYFVNNRIHAFHFGINSIYNSKTNFTLLTSFSKNLGTYAVPFDLPRYQFSSLITLEQALHRLKNTVAKISAAADLGSLYKNQISMYVSLQKTW